MLLVQLFRAFLWLSSVIFGSKPVLSATLRCYIDQVDNFIEVPLDNATQLLKTDCYNRKLNNRFYAFGYEVMANGIDVTTVTEALLSLPKSNVFLMNWEREAAGDEDNTVTEVLTYANVATKEVLAVGTAFGRALTNMAKAGLNLNATHLIGHSLGAHLCGVAGRKLIENNMIVDRITGLDPAGPLFQKPIALMVPLDKTCAKFVDCVHTDYGTYGINSSLCHSDVYIIKLKENVQPGCPVGIFPPLSKNSTCSHNRCWKVYSDSIHRPNTLIAGQAYTFDDWFGCRGDYDNTLTVGINVNRSKLGNFFIRPTNPTPPYGQGEIGRKPAEC